MAISSPFDQTFDTSFELSDSLKTALTYVLIGSVAGPLAVWAAIQTGDIGIFEECFDAAMCAAEAVR